MSPDPKTSHFWDNPGVTSDNEGSPYLYDQDDELGHRPDDVPNPGEWEPHDNPNSDIVDMPNQADNVTDLEWMD